MKKLLAMLTLLAIWTGMPLAQKGTAEPGYYPMGYIGDTWTGEVTSVNEETREFTLSYKRGDKTKTFVGILPKDYTAKMKDGSERQVAMADLMGWRIKAYYITKSKKDDKGVKVTTHEVFKIKFLPKDK